TLSVQALGEALPADARPAIRAWLLAQQTRTEHPYTGAAPGGWAWTPLSGGVPDADDTPGALLALAALKDGDDPEVLAAARAGVDWLLGLQNADGGMPTFCRGWGRLPFDRSCPDLTAHALRAWHAWPSERTPAAVERGLRYLDDAQRPDGAWIPLWFGSQANADETNPVYGTSRVLLCAPLFPGRPAWRRGLRWLLDAQSPEGGWGTSIEETALAVEALASFPEARTAVDRGLAWLSDRTAGGARFPAAPIGLYFARLWYSERLYPIIFTVAALRNA
ncbi:MAG TPA: prenyltransferase/squalene oxidase repeat-containing protein, partial [Planctomycetota bacterium]|nr:prenyltransferase/squalene oxidase repeat-containing protein [Planctomycetota bacterium]